MKSKILQVAQGESDAYIKVLLEAFDLTGSKILSLKDQQGAYIYVSEGYAALKYGVAAENLCGKTSNQQGGVPLEAIEREALSELRAVGERELTLAGPLGKSHLLWARSVPVVSESGQAVGVLTIYHATKERQDVEMKLLGLQQELAETSRLAGMAEVASGVLHNIGNALNGVSTSSSLLSDQLKRSRISSLQKAVQMMDQHSAELGAFLTSDPKGKQVPAFISQVTQAIVGEHAAMALEIDQLRKNLEHIKEVVGMQQNYARLSQQLEELSPVDLVEESLRISEASLNRHGINVEKDFVLVPLVRVARHKVLQILVNLIRNSKHAMDDSGKSDKRLVISLRMLPGDRVAFIIRDNGVGIPSENLAKLFTFGFTTRKDGHGFGLHSSLNAARELHGALTAESEGLGQGAVFSLILPVANS